MANIPPSEFIEADYLKFSKQNGEYFVKTLQANTLVPDKYDYIAMGYPNSTTETFTYKIGGASGTTVATITITYVDSTKAQVSSVAKA